MKYAVDKVEDDIVLLENILNGEKITVQKECFSFPIKETDIVIKKDGAYLKDDKEKEDRIKIIKAKMEDFRRTESLPFFVTGSLLQIS